ncbi:MAG: sugar phosphate isomerase/epimerase [Bryobacterales bacterium]|nr:sugar phosphate isomerase/epimerase [Bryobacterales bacterium]
MLRRTFLAMPALAAARFKQPLGLSLYTVRAPLGAKPEETYKAIGAAGISEVEVRPVNLTDHAGYLRAAGLKPVHMFIDSAVITGAWEEWEKLQAQMAARMKLPAPKAPMARPSLAELIALAKEHRVHRIGVSYLLPGERANSIAKLNEAAEACKKAGVGFYYHNHAFEFEGEPGARFIDRLHKELHPHARLELDVFWAAIGGEEPVALLKQWKGRVGSLHLKDVAATAPRKVGEFTMPPSAFKEVGLGTLDWKGILAAARAAKVDHYMIEQDSTPGDPMDSVRKSVGYLRGLAI